jgi:hypothetical protein
MSEPTTVALVGGGFRAQMFARVVSAVPERFRLAGAVVRDTGRGAAFGESFGVPTWRSVAGARLDGVDVVVVAVSGSASAAVIADLAARTAGDGAGPVILAETPPGVDTEELAALHRLVQDGARIQVAEQYHAEPLLSSQLAVAASGALGRVTQANVTISHGYHGVGVLRRALGIGFEDAEIRATTWTAPLRAGPTRAGDPTQDRLVDAVRTLAWLDFGDRQGAVDFEDQQVRSWVRTTSLLVRGTDGELRDDVVRRLADPFTPVRSRIERLDAGGPGNQEGLFLRGYGFEGRSVFENPFGRARLFDHELGIAVLLDRVGAYARGGPSVYSLAEAAQDRYLDLQIQQAARTGETVRTTRQVWADPPT